MLPSPGGKRELVPSSELSFDFHKCTMAHKQPHTLAKRTDGWMDATGRGGDVFLAKIAGTFTCPLFALFFSKV